MSAPAGEGAPLAFEEASLGGVDGELDGAVVGRASSVTVARPCEEVSAGGVVGLVLLERVALE